LIYLKKNGKTNKSNFRFQFWQHENHPVLLDTNEMLEQRMIYLHENPVRAGFVTTSEQWLYSSAVDYYTENEKGLLELVLLA
jgi:putative transposase